MAVIEELLGSLTTLYVIGVFVSILDDDDFITAVVWPAAAYQEIRRILGRS